MQNKNEFCCESMVEALKDAHVPVSYSPILREYRLDLLNNKSIKYDIDYCPWCATKLPTSLRSTFFDILEEGYGLEPDMNILKNEKLPEEFRTDSWWKKRGLK